MGSANLSDSDQSGFFCKDWQIDPTQTVNQERSQNMLETTVAGPQIDGQNNWEYTSGQDSVTAS